MTTPAHQNITCSLFITNPKSPQNMGAILRAAGCYDTDAVYYSGERYARAKSFATDTKNVSQVIPSEQFLDLSQCLASFTNKPKVIAFELVVGAKPLPQFIHPEHCLYVFGPEDGSISQENLDLCDDVVYVPTKGCMNLAASVNVLLYDRLAKAENTDYSAQVILNSRDVNNQTIFKN